MAWIWSDELAAAAEDAGLTHPHLAAWRRQPAAYALPSGQAVEALARRLLGLQPMTEVGDPTADATRPTAPGTRPPGCDCSLVQNPEEAPIAARR